MNSHNPSWREESPYGDPSRGPPARPCWLVTASPTSRPPVPLDPKRQQREQVQPEAVHEVPVQRRRAEGGHGRGTRQPPEASEYVPQAAETAQHVKPVQRGEDVEERAAGTGREEQPLGGELTPRYHLSRDEQQPETQRGPDEVGGDAPPPGLEHGARGEQKDRVEVQNRREVGGATAPRC